MTEARNPAIEIALLRKNLPITRSEVEALVYGRSWPDIYADIRERYPTPYPTRESIEAVTVPIFRERSTTQDITILPSVDLLRTLSATYPVAIVSGSTRDRIRESVTFLNISDCIRFYLGCEDYPRGKPDPAGFLLAAQKLRTRPESCIVFEDSEAGVLAAKRAGMHCVALQRHNASNQDLQHADQVLDNLGCFTIESFREHVLTDARRENP